MLNRHLNEGLSLSEKHGRARHYSRTARGGVMLREMRMSRRYQARCNDPAAAGGAWFYEK